VQAEQAPDGRTHGELSHRLGVRVHNPLLELIHAGRLGRFLRRPPEDQRVHRALRRMRDRLDPIVCEVPFAAVEHTRRWRASLFDELRDALGLVPETTGRNPPTRAGQDDPARAGPSGSA
jgi:hypothetical protein